MRTYEPDNRFNGNFDQMMKEFDAPDNAPTFLIDPLADRLQKLNFFIGTVMDIATAPYPNPDAAEDLDMACRERKRLTNALKEINNRVISRMIPDADRASDNMFRAVVAGIDLQKRSTDAAGQP